ncbi:MAG: CoA transferase [Candidatus Bathyarchaeota archaeon]|nr:CoA transferase [Candidatus Bathyarchaeota archaeon]
MKILEDIRVLDLTQFWFGPFCTMMLADMGAEVIRIEPPWGSVDRLADAYIAGGSSYTFHQLNLNKKGLTLNLKTEEGLRVFKDLVPKADIVVQNFRPGTMERLGLGYDVLKELNPKLIYAALSGFGQTGPYTARPCFAPIAEAMSGHTRLTGDGVDPNGPPIEMAQAYGDLGPGLFAAMSIIAAIRHRDQTGVAQMIDVAQFDCMTALNMAITGYNLSGMLLHEIQDKYPMARGFGGLFKAKDGYIRLASFSPRLIDDLREYMGVDEVTEDLIEEMVKEMTRDEAVAYFVAARVPVAPVYKLNDVVEDEHLIERNMFTTVQHKNAGPVKVVNFPVKFSETPIQVENASPIIGEHNESVLRGLLGYGDEEIDALKKANAIAERSQ